MQNYLDFEKPIAELETRVAELRETAASSDDIDIDAEVSKLEAKAGKLLKDTYAKLSPWQKAQVARHPDRPHFKDYLAGIADDFVPLAGDRSFADDAAIVGEGGSGGAVAIASANRVLMFEHAVYSVISPEGCASILWRTADKAAEAAEAMKITAQDQQALGVIDRIIPEPLGGAHRDPEAAIGALKGALIEELDGCSRLSATKLREQRRAKFLAIG